MRNWVYYMQEGLKSMWSKKPKKIDFNDRTRENKINKLEIETKLKEKFSPVDNNLYPAGFNNLCNLGINTTSWVVNISPVVDS